MSRVSGNKLVQELFGVFILKILMARSLVYHQIHGFILSIIFQGNVFMKLLE